MGLLLGTGDAIEQGDDGMVKISVSLLSVLFLTCLAAAQQPATAPSTSQPAKAGLLFDLSKVQGIEKFRGCSEAKELLAKNGIVITGQAENRLARHYATERIDSFRVMTEMERKARVASESTTEPATEPATEPWEAPTAGLPLFITTDCGVLALLQAYEKAFEKLERHQAVALGKHLHDVWKKLVEMSADLPPVAREDAVAFVAVALKLSDDKWQDDSEAGKKLLDASRQKIDAELDRVKKEQVAFSPVFGQSVDYSLCKPRSFYVGDLEGFYRARTFLGFPINLKHDGACRLAIALGWLSRSSEEDHCNLFGQYLDLQQPYEWLVGRQNMESIVELGIHLLGSNDVGKEERKARGKRLLVAVGGGDLSEVRKQMQSHVSQILDVGATEEIVLREIEEKPLVVAYWPKSVLPDAILMQKLTYPSIARMPTGLDALACCGNDRALAHLLAMTGKETQQALKEKVQELRTEADHNSGPRVWAGWRGLFETLWKPNLTDRHPKFMKTQAYQDKSLNTSLGAWAGYRHTFQLQAEEHSHCFGIMPTPPPGYVEPNPEFWGKLSEFSLDLQEAMGEYDAAVGELASVTKMGLTAKEIAIAQLAGKPLTPNQAEWLRGFEDVLGNISIGCKVKNDAIIGTVSSQRDTQRALHVGLSLPQTVYVIFDYGGNLILAKGGVLSYREFWRPISDGRMNDDQWRELIEKGNPPAAPAWLSEVSAGKLELPEVREKEFEDFMKHAEEESATQLSNSGKDH